jgi:hypothetical protein
MSDFSLIGKWIVLMGLALVAIGSLLWVSGKIPFVGRLPGDLRFERQNFKFYFPLTTCLLSSVAGSLLLWIFSKFK